MEARSGEEMTLLTRCFQMLLAIANFRAMEGKGIVITYAFTASGDNGCGGLTGFENIVIVDSKRRVSHPSLCIHAASPSWCL